MFEIKNLKITQAKRVLDYLSYSQVTLSNSEVEINLDLESDKVDLSREDYKLVVNNEVKTGSYVLTDYQYNDKYGQHDYGLSTVVYRNGNKVDSNISISAKGVKLPYFQYGEHFYQIEVI